VQALKHLEGVDERTLEFAAKSSITRKSLKGAMADIKNMIQERDASNSRGTKKVKKRSEGRERDLVLSTLVKILRGDQCQLCGQKYDLEGRFFCETHHIVPLSEGGLDLSTNMVVVCPNHHKILDAIGAEIVKKNSSSLTIQVANEQYMFDI
jgi:predicted HNH restriction endonuclease